MVGGGGSEERGAGERGGGGNLNVTNTFYTNNVFLCHP